MFLSFKLTNSTTINRGLEVLDENGECCLDDEVHVETYCHQDWSPWTVFYHQGQKKLNRHRNDENCVRKDEYDWCHPDWSDWRFSANGIRERHRHDPECSRIEETCHYDWSEWSPCTHYKLRCTLGFVCKERHWHNQDNCEAQFDLDCEKSNSGIC